MTTQDGTTSIFSGYDTTLPQEIINRQSDTNLRIAAMAALSRYAPGLDQVEGSWAFDLIAPFCLIVAQAYYDLIDIERRTSLATATGLGLDRLGELYGVTRAPAAHADGVVTFTGTSGSRIPWGTYISTTGANPQTFQTTVEAQIPGLGTGVRTVNVPVRAVVAGAAGNVPTGSITLFTSWLSGQTLPGQPPTGVTAVTNTAPTEHGANVQPDGAPNQFYQGYRGDIYILANARGEGGAAKHLRKWARSVPGVGGVTVLEVTPTSGWVTLVLLDRDGAPASAELIHAVEARILDPWYLYNEAEVPPVSFGNGATYDEQPDGTPIGSARNVIRMQGTGSLRQTLWGPTVQYLPQPGVWRLKPRMKVSSSAGTAGLFTMGIWDYNTDNWAYSRPNNQGIQAFTTVAANQLSEGFIAPDIDTNQIDFAWNGYDRIELRIDMAGGDMTTVLWTDQVNYFAVQSRDDRDVGLSPAGMRVNVIPALPVTVNVSATITYQATVNLSRDTIDAAIQRNIEAYFRAQALGVDRSIRRADIENAIYTTGGVGDVGDVMLNGTLLNVPIRPTEVPVMGTLTWTVV